MMREILRDFVGERGEHWTLEEIFGLLNERGNLLVADSDNHRIRGLAGARKPADDLEYQRIRDEWEEKQKQEEQNQADILECTGALSNSDTLAMKRLRVRFDPTVKPSEKIFLNVLKSFSTKELQYKTNYPTLFLVISIDFGSDMEVGLARGSGY